MVNYDIKKIYEWPLGARALILASLLILILLLGYYLDIAPYRVTIYNSAQQEEDLKGQLKLMLDKQITMKNDIAQLLTVNALVLNWQQKILTKAELPGMLDEILKLGQTNNLKIIAFNPANEVKDGIYYKTPVSIDLSGTYDNIASFLSQLINMPKLVNIDAFTLNNDNPKSASANGNSQQLNSDDILTAQLDIEIYRR